MNNLEFETLKRIKSIDPEILNNTIDRLRYYGINFYNEKGEFVFNNFRKDCVNTMKLLDKNEKPHFETNIKYQICDFLSNVEVLVGKRNFSEFFNL